MKLMIIDGNSIVNRAFYGVRPLSAPDGTPTNAVYGFLSIYKRLLEEEKPQAVAVAFDLRAPTFRHKAYEGYKATRKGMPEELAVQMPILKEVLDAMGIRRCELEGWEADDLLGTISRRCAGDNCECVVVTGDKDSLQLIGEHVRVLNVKTRMGNTETVDYTAERFREEYGFDPIRMIDLKALMGDSSDNIPGVPGVGEKTAMDLLHRFGSLDGVYENIDDASIKAGLRKKLTEGQESARLSYQLATIDRDAPYAFSVEEALLPEVLGGEVYTLFKRLGFNRFVEKWGIQPPKAEEKPAAVFEGTCSSILCTNGKELTEALNRLGENTAYLWQEEDALAFVWDEGNDSVACILFKNQYEDDYTAALGKIYAPSVKKAGHNIKNIQRNLLEMGVDGCENWVFDAALAGYLLDATASGYELDRLTMAYCGFEVQTAAPEGEQLSLLDDAVMDETARVADLSARAAAIAALEEVMVPKLRELGMEKLYYDMELPLCAVLARMEKEGFLADKQALIRYGEVLSLGIEALQQRIWLAAEEEFNINSPKQLGVILFEKLGLPGGKKTKTGWSTNADVLDKLRHEPIVRDVLEYRELAKLKSTYAEGLLKVIGPDGRIHTNFQMTVTATGRLSSTEPNLQNIPVRKELGAELRKMFVASPGHVLVDADYSQIELRLLAHISGDENMRDAFLSGEDVHKVTAAQVFGIPLEDVTPEERRRAKAVNFGIVYGISAFSLSQDLGVFVNEAKAYMDAYFSRFHGVRDYQKNIVEQAREQGYVATLFGRRRYLPELKNTNFAMRSFGERVALNMPIQGTAADVIKLAMVNVDRRLRKEGLAGRLILQVHDELIVECPEGEKEAVAALLEEEMRNAVNWSVPLLAEAKIGRSWAEAH